MDGEKVFIWGSAEDDFNQLLKALHAWVKRHRGLFGPVGPFLTVNLDRLAPSYDEIHRFLRVFGSSANACKRASTVVVSFCMHCPIVADGKVVQELTDSERRALLLANAKAAYEIGEAIARRAVHCEPDPAHPWHFSRRAKFPSIHSYVEFLASLAKLDCMSRGACPATAIEQCIARIAIILELNFYRNNDGIAGITDKDFWNEMTTSPGMAEYTFLNLNRNADDKVKLPGGYQPKFPTL